MKDVKYFAGLFDADGTFGISPRKLSDGTYHIRVCVALYQKDQEQLMIDLGKHFNVSPNFITRDQMYSITFFGNKGIRLIQHLRKHLVIKKLIADFVCSLEGMIVSKEELKDIREQIKLKRLEQQPEKNFPARKWMAGYIDGDGCIRSQFNKKGGGLEFRLAIVSHESQMSAIKLIQKCFGGVFRKENKTGVIRYQLTLSPNNIDKLEYFGKHLKIKFEQYELVHDVLSNRKHYLREGATPESNYDLHLKLQNMKCTRND